MHKKTILCFGDSNTHGYCAETGGRFDETVRYPCLLKEFLGSDYMIREEGLSGRTTVFEDPLFESMSGLSSIFSCIMSHKPIDLLIIMLGTNDTKERFSANPENIAKGMERLIQKAISIKEGWKNKNANILIIAPPPISDGYKSSFIYNEMGNGCVEKSKELPKYYKEVASLNNCHFLNAGEIPGIEMHSNDHMHLTAMSHRILAKYLADMIPTVI